MNTKAHCISSLGDKLRRFASRVLPVLLVGTWLVAPAFAQHHIYTFDGGSSFDGFGHCVSGAGDVNKDGYPDLIVGAVWDDNNGTNSGSARVLSGKDGRVLYTFNGDGAGASLGWAVSGAGDLDGDGFADLVVGAPWDSGIGFHSGIARVLSGANGRVLHTFKGAAFDLLGGSVSAAGDVNKDGFPDLVVGAPGPKSTGTGYARVLSGEWIVATASKRTPKTIEILYTWRGKGGGDRFGYSVSGAGDVNKDGYADVIVGAPREDGNGRTDVDAGVARVFSGKNGLTLHTFVGTSANDLLGWAVSGAGDLDWDGHADLIVGAPQWPANGKGYVRVFSGRTGGILYPKITFTGDAANDRFGWAVGNAGDVNKDGANDFIVGATQLFPSRGFARVFSGLDGKVLHTFRGLSGGDWFGGSVTGIGDVNKDGYADLAVGAQYDDNNGSNSGSARVMSGKKLTLRTYVHQLSLNQAGTQKLILDAGTQHAGRSYWIFGSWTDTAPGVTLNGVHIRLKPDLYTDITIALPNTAMFQNFKGTLDSSGRASAFFNLPSGMPPIPIPITLYHAYLVYDAQGTWLMASNPATLLLK